MSGSVNRAILIGNLGANPELKYTPAGKAVCELRLATNESWKDKSGQLQKHTEWHRVIVWDKIAENCSQHLTKGRQIYVEGKITTRKWQDKHGQDRYTTEIVAHQVVFLGGERSETGDRGEPDPVRREQGPASGPAGSAMTDDDMPF